VPNLITKNAGIRAGKVVPFSSLSQSGKKLQAALSKELPFDAGYQMPDRLVQNEAYSGSDAQSDATFVQKQSFGRLKQFLSKPENANKFATALVGHLDTTRSPKTARKIQQAINVILAIGSDELMETLSLPKVATAVNVPSKLLLSSMMSNALPLPVAMAYVDRPVKRDIIIFSQDLGFRDMQLHAQSASLIFSLKVVNAEDIKFNPNTALPRLAAAVTGNDTGENVSFALSEKREPKPIRIMLDREVHKVEGYQYSLDGRLAE